MGSNLGNMQLSGNNLTSVTYEKCFLAVLTNNPKHMLLKKTTRLLNSSFEKTVVIKYSPVHIKLFYEIYKFSPDPYFSANIRGHSFVFTPRDTV